MHRTTPQFWKRLEALPKEIQELAHKNFAILKNNPRHPSLQFKQIGDYWSARVGLHYRALAVEDGADYVWVWIGAHAEYERRIR